MSLSVRPAVLLVVSLLVSAQALAGSVFLNGVNVDGLTDQTFEKVNVRLDEKGNVHIDAPGYSATVVQPGKTRAQITRRYWLATEEPTPGMAEYEVDVYVNSKWIRRVKSGEDQVVADITKHLVPGKNSVVMTARKIGGEARKSVSERHFLRVIVGEGSASKEQVTIDNPLARFTRTAAETKDVSEEFTIETR